MKKIIMFMMIAACLMGVNKAEAQQPITWQMAIGAPESNYQARIVREFSEEVATNSNGSLRINIHYRGSLLTQPNILRGVRTNQVQLGKLLISIHGNEDPFFELEGVPFLADTWQDTNKLRSIIDPIISDRLNQRGVTLLYSIYWTSQGFYTQRPIESIADMRGMRLRAYNPITSRMATLMQTQPMTVVAGEIPQAFMSNMLQAMFTSAQTGVDFSAWDYSRVFTDVGGMRNRSVIVVNNSAFSSLSPQLRAIVLQAAQRANERGEQYARESEVNAVRILSERGIQTPQPSETLMRELRGIGAQLTAEWISRAGEEGRTVIEQYRRIR